MKQPLKIFKRNCSLFVILLLLFVWRPTFAFSQRLDLSISPPHMEILLKPGVSLLEAIELKNMGDAAVFSTHIVSFVPSGDSGGRVFKDRAEGPIRFSLENSNLELGEKFFLESKKSTQALLKIRAIDNAPEGDYYYTFFFVSEPPVSQQTSSRARGYIGANILITITESGILSSEGKIAQFQVVPDYTFSFLGTTIYFVDSFKGVRTILKIANTGKNIVTPKSTVSLKGPFVGTKKRKLLPLNVLSNSERVIFDKESDCDACSLRPSATFSGFVMGRYMLSADVEFEGGNKKLYASSNFFAFPFIFLYITTALIVGVIVTWAFMKAKKGTKK